MKTEITYQITATKTVDSQMEAEYYATKLLHSPYYFHVEIEKVEQ